MVLSVLSLVVSHSSDMATEALIFHQDEHINCIPPFEETLALLSKHWQFFAALLTVIIGSAVVVNLFPSLQTVGFLSASAGDFLRFPQ